MAPLAALLWRSLRVHQVYGANTDVGKTIFTTILCNAARKGWKDENISYLKPVSTGASEDADDRYVPPHLGDGAAPLEHIKKYAPGVAYETLIQYDLPASPHSAAQLSGQKIPSDWSLLTQIHSHACQVANQSPGWLFLETAGGVHSPGPSGTTQAELYTPLRVPVVLVGDSKLGGISQTISAFESLRLRGYDVESVLLFRDQTYENYRHLTDYFGEKYGIPVSTVAEPPEKSEIPDIETAKMKEYYDEQSSDNSTVAVLDHLNARHQSRIKRLDSMASKAHSSIWYPFTQHTLLPAEKITAIDSAHGDYFQTLKPVISNESSPDECNGSLLQASFDGSASWWTQGLGHANSHLTLAAAYAAGRYGHVMFAEAVHEPALALTEELLSGMRNPRLSRVFISDNGSTGCEVAVKMSLRAARVRYGWGPNEKLSVLGLKGSYHGDTIGVMDCAEPCAYNEKIEWYEGKGYWFDFPKVRCTEGKWFIDVPEAQQVDLGEGKTFASLDEIFDVEAREQNGEGKAYESFIEKTLEDLQKKGYKFGALMLEPIILGAGGMLFVDPLFQRTLVNAVRRSTHLFTTSPVGLPESPDAWTGLPIVFDEVFTGLYRLGRYTPSSFLGVHPDISVHAKLLTGGLVPLCTTLASESVFDVFRSNDKTDALLHGHSYTAHPVGCQVAVESVREMVRMEETGAWDWAKESWTPSTSSSSSDLSPRDINDSQVWSSWPRPLIDFISHQTAHVSGVWALGSVLAITLRDDSGTGYTSTAATVLQKKLREGGEGWNVHARVLGNVFYVMAGQKTGPGSIEGVGRLIKEGLEEM